MLKWLLLLLFSGSRQEYIYSNRPLPKAEVLDEVLSKVINRTDYTGSLFSYLTGNEDFGDPDNLDVCVLDANNVFKIISKAKKQYEPWFRRTKTEALNKNPRLVQRALDLMRQSIYATRYRMQDTKRFRKHFANDARFHIAVLYGALMQVTLKIETLYTIMKKLNQKHTFLIWFVILYEKILAAHVDIHNLVDRIFDFHTKQLRFNEGERVRWLPRQRRTRTRGRMSRGTGDRFTERYEIPTHDDANMTDQTITAPVLFDTESGEISNGTHITAITDSSEGKNSSQESSRDYSESTESDSSRDGDSSEVTKSTAPPDSNPYDSEEITEGTSVQDSEETTISDKNSD